MNDDLFGNENRGVTLTDMRKCIERELAYRHRVYPRLVSQGRMHSEQATREIIVMTALLAMLEKMQNS